MRCPKTGFMCDESQKYMAEINLSDGKEIYAKSFVGDKRPVLFCRKCKEQTNLDTFIEDDEQWAVLTKKFAEYGQQAPDKLKSFIKWIPTPRLQ